jgi:hypothetical protein
MGADILAGRNCRTRGWWRASFRFVNTAEREIAERRQRAGGDTGSLEKNAPIQTSAWLICLQAGQPFGTLMTLRPLDQHGGLPYRVG